MECQLRVIAFVFYAGAVALFIAIGIGGCARPGLAIGIGAAVGAALIAGAHNDASPDGRETIPPNPCVSNPGTCR